MSWRDLLCGDVRPEHVGQKLALAGWVNTRRDHGGLVFIDLRDHTGVCQLVINPERTPEAHAAAHGVRPRDRHAPPCGPDTGLRPS